MTLQEQFKQFSNELSRVSGHRAEIEDEYQKAHTEYHRTLTNQQELLELGENDKAKKLDVTLKDLRAKVERLREQINQNSSDSIKNKVKRHKEAKLHVMALSIQEAGFQQMEALQKETDKHTKEIEKARKQYLSAVGKARELYRELTNVCLIVRRAEECLPVSKSAKVRVPKWDAFSLDEEVEKTYGPRLPII